MRLGAHCPVLVDLQIEQKLIGVVIGAELAKRRPLQIAFRRRAEIAVEDQGAVLFRDMQFVGIGIEDLDAACAPSV